MSGTQSMHSLVEAYLAFRRHAGYQLLIEGQQLFRFAAFADESGHTGPITLELAMAWATFQRRNSQTNRLTAARRIEVIRSFARYHRQFEPDTEIPPARLYGQAHRRKMPHIYTDDEVCDLLDHCATLHPVGGLRGISCRAIFGLIAATGMRVSEVTGLRHQDVNLDIGQIEVRKTKFGKSRLLPIHSSVVHELKRYSLYRDSVVTRLRLDTPFFVNDYGWQFTSQTARYAFGQIRSQLGWQARGEHQRPRIHDLRHTFITRTLLRWQDQGTDVDRSMLSLSTYVGHVRVTDTYWYLTATPALMAAAAKRFSTIDVVEDQP